MSDTSDSDDACDQVPTRGKASGGSKYVRYEAQQSTQQTSTATTMAGRGRGEAVNIHRLEEDSEEASGSGSGPTGTGSSKSGDSPEKTVRGRGGYRATELCTIPTGINIVTATPEQTSQKVQVLANYVRINPMKEREIHKYRVDFAPNIDSTKLRGKMVRENFGPVLGQYVFDLMHDIRSNKLHPKPLEKVVPSPGDSKSDQIKITIKHVGKVDWSSFEMIRLYNMHARGILQDLDFYPININNQRAFLHQHLVTPVGSAKEIQIVGGFRTAVNLHMGENILCNLETVHKVMQMPNIYEMMTKLKSSGSNIRETIREFLQNKLAVTSYKKRVYKIEDVLFDENPRSTFMKDGKPVSYIDYFQSKHQVVIKDPNQPLLHCSHHGRKPGNEQEDMVKLIPELCNMAGLTAEQINRARTDMIRATQVSPADRVRQMYTLLKKIHDEPKCKQRFADWGYKFDTDPCRVNARILGTEVIQLGSSINKKSFEWPKVDQSASFDQHVLRDKLAMPPKFHKMAVVVPASLKPCEQSILNSLKGAFDKIGLVPENVAMVRMYSGENTANYIQYIRELPEDVTAAIVLMPFQNKEKYDAIKKCATVEKGLITQVVTGRLMNDARKANGASVKIGIQVAAKIGGEPWYANFPLKEAMVCGYDTYHDTVNRRCSFGAFVASMNDKASRWYSKVDRHDQIEELSAHLTENLILALRTYKEKNGKFPTRVFVYRDGVGDGDIEHVFNLEVSQIKRAISEVDRDVKLTFIIVNKRVGARFFFQSHPGAPYLNCPPGTVVDDTVTRKERFDFYLISQSTRAGTVSPTYYNIICDQSGLKPEHHQAMAFKFCFLYYNWAGTVRVPAPCQYAHKLALLCGEHLHQLPHTSLDDRLHFL